MKVIYILVLIYLKCVVTGDPPISNAVCPANFKCNKTLPSNLCASKSEFNNTKNITNPPLWTIIMKPNACKEEQICNFLTGACSEIATLTYPATPGQKVKSSKFCKSKKAINGVCQGVSLDSECKSDNDCDPGLYCKSNKCSNYTMYGKTCKIGTDKCQFSYKCQIYNSILYGNSSDGKNSTENTCTRFNSSLSAFSFFFKICKQNTNDTDIATRCIALGSLIYNATNASDVCKYSNGERAKPVCAGNGSVYCFKGLGDVSDLTDNFFLYLKANPPCTYSNPICSNGKNILSPSLYSTVINGISNLLNIPLAINSTGECLNEYISFLRAGVSSIRPKLRNLEEDPPNTDIDAVLGEMTSQYNDQQNEANANTNQAQDTKSHSSQFINLFAFLVLFIILL